MRRLMTGLATAVVLAGLLALFSGPKRSAAINCDIFWYAIECWFAQ